MQHGKDEQYNKAKTKLQQAAKSYYSAHTIDQIERAWAKLHIAAIQYTVALKRSQYK